MKKNLKKAFTLVEMMIVIIIIGILMSALLPKLMGAQAGARDTARKLDVAHINTALISYFNDNGEYPDGTCAKELSGDLKSYIRMIPTDPQGKRVTYGTTASGCTSGSYAYSALKSNAGDKAGSVVIANLEKYGKGPNWVLSGTTTATFTTGTEESDILTGVCKKVIETGGTSTTCDSDTHIGQTSNQNEMVFVLFN